MNKLHMHICKWLFAQWVVVGGYLKWMPSSDWSGMGRMHVFNVDGQEGEPMAEEAVGGGGVDREHGNDAGEDEGSRFLGRESRNMDIEEYTQRRNKY